MTTGPTAGGSSIAGIVALVVVDRRSSPGWRAATTRSPPSSARRSASRRRRPLAPPTTVRRADHGRRAGDRCRDAAPTAAPSADRRADGRPRPLRRRRAADGRLPRPAPTAPPRRPPAPGAPPGSTVARRDDDPAAARRPRLHRDARAEPRRLRRAPVDARAGAGRRSTSCWRPAATTSPSPGPVATICAARPDGPAARRPRPVGARRSPDRVDRPRAPRRARLRRVPRRTTATRSRTARTSTSPPTPRATSRRPAASSSAPTRIEQQLPQRRRRRRCARCASPRASAATSRSTCSRRQPDRARRRRSRCPSPTSSQDVETVGCDDDGAGVVLVPSRTPTDDPVTGAVDASCQRRSGPIGPVSDGQHGRVAVTKVDRMTDASAGIDALLAENRTFPPPERVQADALVTGHVDVRRGGRGRPGLLGPAGRRAARLGHRVGHDLRVGAAVRQVVRRRQAQRRPQLPRPPRRRRPRRQGRHPLRGRAGRHPHDHLRRAARRGVRASPTCSRASASCPATGSTSTCR